MGLGALQPWHLIVLLIVVLLIFGAGKLPEVGKAFGKSIKEFKSEVGGNDAPVAKSTTVESVTTNSVAPTTTSTVPTLEEPEVVRRTIRTLEDGSQEIVEERVVRKRVSN